MKRTWFQAKIKQDIAISTQNGHERHSTHKRGSYSIFTKRRHPQVYISQSYQDHSYTSYEQQKQSHKLISSISWSPKHMREAHLYVVCYKFSLWYKDANMIWYTNENATCICTSTLPTEAQKGKTTPTSPRDRANVAWSKGLVRISQVAFLQVHGQGLCFSSQHCPSESGTSLLCVWFWSGAQGFWQH
jgi:hypothetical protein